MGKEVIILLDRGIYGKNPLGGGQFCRQEVFKVIRTKIDAHYVFITHQDNVLAKMARDTFDQVIILDYVFFEKYRYMVRLWEVMDVLKSFIYLIKGSNKLLKVIDQLVKEQNVKKIIVFPNENYSRLIFMFVKLRRWKRCVGVMVVDNEYNRQLIDKLLVRVFHLTYSEIYSASKAVLSPYRKFRKVQVVYPGVDIDALLGMRDNNGINEPNFIEGKHLFKICLIGSLIDVKRPSLALEIVAKLIHKERYKVVLNVIGTGPLLGKLRRLSKKLNLKEGIDVIFRGHLSKKDTIRILDASDVLIHTSASESFGRSVAEAQVLGKPAVVSRVAALPEIVMDKITGYTVEKNDVNGFVQKIKILYDNRELRQEMGERAFKNAKKFHIKYTAAKYAEGFSRYINI